MTKLSTLFFLLFLSLFIQAQEYIALSAQAQNHFKNNDMSSAYVIGKLAVESIERDSGINCLSYANVLGDLGIICQHIGKYPESISYYFQSSKIKKDLLGRHDPSYYQSVSRIVLLYKELKQYEKAIYYLDPIVKDLFGQIDTERLSFIYYSNLLIDIYILFDKYEEAQELLNMTMSYQVEVNGIHNIEYALLQHKYVGLLLENGEFEHARRTQRTVIQSIAKNGQETGYDFIEALHQSGEIEMKAKDFGAAKIYFTNALAYAKNNLNRNNPELNKYLIELAVLHEKRGEFVEAEPFYLESMISYQNSIHNQLPVMSAGEQISFLEKFYTHYALFKAFAVKRYLKNPGILTALYDIQINVQEMISHALIENKDQHLLGIDSQLKSQYKEWNALRFQLHGFYYLNNTELIQMNLNLDTLEKRKADLEKILSEKLDWFSNKQPAYSRFKEVVSRLKDDEVAIEVVRIASKDAIKYAFLILNDSSINGPNIVLLENGKELEGSILDKYYGYLFSKSLDEESYEHLWSNVERSIGTARKAYISSDGIYSKLNINSLYNKESEKYLFDEMEILGVSSTANLLKSNMNISLPNKGKAYLFGQPDYKTENNTKSLFADTIFNSNTGLVDNNHLKWFSNLKNSKSELEEINDILKTNEWSTHIYLDSNAIEQEFSFNLPADVIHLSMNGFFDFIESESNQTRTSPKNDFNSLLNSGMLMTGSFESMATLDAGFPLCYNLDDGILSGYEILNLNLSNTNTVILSQCFNGIDHLELKSTYAYHELKKAFLYSGVKYVIAPAYLVDEEVTTSFTKIFYRLLIKGERIEDAFKNTQIKLKKRNSNPYYWASFTLITG